MKVSALALGVLLGVGCAPRAPLPSPSPDPSLAVFVRQLGSRHYGLYRDGHKVGWMRSTFGEDLFRGAPVLVAEGHAEIVLAGGGAVLRTLIESKHTFSAEPPYSLLRVRTSSSRGGVERWQELRPSPGGSGWVEISARGTEQEQVRPVELGEYTLARFLGIERWIAAGPDLGESTEVIRVEGGGLVRGEASVVGLTHTVIDAIPTRVYSVATLDGTGAAVVTRYDEDGRILATRGGEVELRFEEAEAARTLEAPVDLFLDSLVRVDGALRPRAGLTRLLLSVPAAAGPLLPSGSGQRLLRGDGLQLELVAGRDAPVEPAELSAALASDREHPLGEPRVGDLLGRALPRRATPKEKVALLATFVRDFLEDDRSAEPLDLAAVIDARRGDCTEHAALFVTLCRAAGVPAREVTGLLWVEELGAFGGHAWAEVALDGRWLPVDPTWGQVPADAAHLQLFDPPQLAAAARRVLGAGPISVLEVEPGA